MTLLSEAQLRCAQRFNPYYQNRLRWPVPAGWPSDVANITLAQANERPAHRVKVGGFWMDRHHVDNAQFRLLKAHTPGAYTFVLQGSTEVPRRLMHEKRKTIGIRVPDNAICQALLAELGEPLITTTLLLPGEDYPRTDPDEIRDALERQVDLVIDGGPGSLEETSVVSLVDGAPAVLRAGAGPVDGF